MNLLEEYGVKVVTRGTLLIDDLGDMIDEMKNGKHLKAISS